jgi:hypothetical protein
MGSIISQSDIKNRLAPKLEEINGKARERILTVDDCIKHLEYFMSRIPCTKKALKGTEIMIHACMERFPRAYKYTPYETRAKFTFDGVYWVFNFAEREPVKYTNGNHIMVISFS